MWKKNSQNLGARTLFALNEVLSTLAAPFLALVSRTVDSNVRGENRCKDTFFRTRGTLICTKDTFSRTKLSIQIPWLHHAFPSDALGDTCGAWSFWSKSCTCTNLRYPLDLKLDF